MNPLIAQPSKSPRLRRALTFLALAVFASAVRLAYLAQIRDLSLVRQPLMDSRAYYEWAGRIAAGDWLGSDVFYQAPLYPYVLALVRLAVTSDPVGIRIVQALAGGLSCGLLYLAGVRFLASEAAAAAAALLLALHAPAVLFDGLIQKTVLDGLLTCALLAALGGLAQRPAGPRWGAAGALLGGLALTRENALLYGLIIPVWTWVRFRAHAAAQRLRWMGAFALGLALVLGAVGLRNQHVAGEFLPTTSQLGTNFFIGNNPRANGSYVPLRAGREDPRYERADAVELAEAALGTRLSARQVSDYWLGQALRFIREEPAAWLRLTVKKWFLVWNADEISDSDDYHLYRRRSSLLRALGALDGFGVLLALALAGTVLTWNERRDLWILYAMVLGMAVGVALFYVFARYRFAFVPMLALLAGAGLARGWRAWRARGARALALPCLAAVGGLVVAHLPLAPPYDPVPGMNNLARAASELGRAEEAIALYEDILARHPGDAGAHSSLGLLLAEQGRRAEAEREYRAALAVDPEESGALNNLALLVAEDGDLAEAEGLFRRMVTAAPREAAGWRGLAMVLAWEGKLDEARAAAEQAVQRNPGDAAGHGNLGAVLQRMGDLRGAIAAYRRSVEIDPSNAGVWLNLGMAQEAGGDIAAAQDAYRRASALGGPEGERARRRLDALGERAAGSER